MVCFKSLMSSICVPLLLVSLQDDDWFTETVELDKVCTMTLCSTMAGRLSLLEGRGGEGRGVFVWCFSVTSAHTPTHTYLLHYKCLLNYLTYACILRSCNCYNHLATVVSSNSASHKVWSLTSTYMYVENKNRFVPVSVGALPLDTTTVVVSSEAVTASDDRELCCCSPPPPHTHTHTHTV